MFVEISLLLALCAVVSIVMRFLKQPLIIGYIITGLLVGPSLLGLISTPETIEVLGEFGVILLLFIVGLGLNPKVVKEVGKVSFVTGLSQIILTCLLGYWVSGLLGFDKTTSIYIAVSLTFSSTIIILKLLSDKKEQNKLFGKISIGLLLVQDIVATIVLVVASASSKGSITFSDLLPLAIKSLVLFILTFLTSQLLISRLTNFLSRSQELLFIFAIAWGFGVSTLFAKFNLSAEVGALLAGSALATMPYAQEVGSRLRPLRDFFLIVFFIVLGTRLNLGDLNKIIAPAIALSIVVIILKPLIVMATMGILGYTKKNSFKTGVAIAQVSEFSLIFIMIGAKNNQISQEVVSLIMIVAIFSIAISSYMITYSEGLYNKLEPLLRMFERKKTKSIKDHRTVVDAIIFGFKRGGREYTKTFDQLHKKYVIIDYDPDVIDDMDRQNLPYIYGDATDLQLLEEINLESTKFVVSVLTDHTSNKFILHHLNQYNPKCIVVCHADSVPQAIELYELGANLVILPHYIGNEKVSGFIKRNGFKKTEFNKYKDKHMSYLLNHFESSDS